jgi:hypothetical protein
MCYSVESSAKTSALSLFAIILLLQSNIPHFKWIGVMMVGWCGMQMAEFLLWLTNPRSSCTSMNKLVTLTIIPLVLLAQPLCGLIGSFFVKPWSACSDNRKLFIVIYSIIIVLSTIIYFYKGATKYCTTVTPDGHLDWWLSSFAPKYTNGHMIRYYVWLIMIIFPIFLLWDISYKAVFAISILPLFGFFYGLKTDSSASIWCHYTSFTAIVSILIYVLYKFNIYNILK